MIKTFNDMKNQLRQCGQSYRIAAVCVYDKATRDALCQVESDGIASTVFIDGDSPEEAAAKGVQTIREGELSVAEIPTYHKLLFFSDAAVIPYPTQEQRIEQVRYAASICRKIGISTPRIALIHCSEKPSNKFPFVDGYRDIRMMAEAGIFGACLVDGPLDVKSACSAHALNAKGITSVLNGDADVLIMPDIEAGNAFYKSMTLFADAHTAGILCGTLCPVVVPSRGDSSEAKYNSILFALAAL